MRRSATGGLQRSCRHHFSKRLLLVHEREAVVSWSPILGAEQDGSRERGCRADDELRSGPDTVLRAPRPIAPPDGCTVHGVDRERPHEHPDPLLRHRRSTRPRARDSTESRNPGDYDPAERAATRVEVHPRYGRQPRARCDVGGQPPLALACRWVYPCGGQSGPVVRPTDRGRYGDSFGASQDSSDPGIVWVAGEYGTATGWATFIAAMAETVRFTAGYAVQGGGSGYLPPTLTYVAGGQSVTVALAASPAVYTVDAGTAWSVSAILGGSDPTERWATNETVSGIAMRSESLAFHYSHQFSASFNYRVTGGGSGYAAPSVSYEQFALARSNDANLTVWVDAGTPYSFPSSLGGSNASERWMADAPDRSGTVGVSAVVEIAYRHQAFLMFGFQGPAESSMSPRTGWYDVGASLRPSVNPAAGWAVGAWQGTGPGAYSGRPTSPTIPVVGPVSEIAILYPGLTLTAGARGCLSYAYGGTSGTVAGGSSHTFYVPTGTTVTIVASPASSYTFVQWSGASSSNRSSVDVTVAGPAQVTANFSLSASAVLAYYSAIAAVAIIAALVLLAVAFRRRRRRSEPPPPPPEPPLPPPPPP